MSNATTRDQRPKKPSAARDAPAMLSTAAAAAELGVTVSQFATLARREEIEPDKTYTNPHYRSGPPAKLYLKRKIANLKRHIAPRPRHAT